MTKTKPASDPPTKKTADAPPLALLEAWLDESYRAQAPRKLVAALGSRR